MRICFYTPFKPLGHGHPSGDLIIAKSLYRYLTGRGHTVCPVSALRLRWIFWKPWLWPLLLRERRRAFRLVRRMRADLWLTYHTYYKAPDVLGPDVCGRTSLPYVVFQGIYATKRRKHITTWAGYMLNKRALDQACHVFTNRREDLLNLQRIVAPDRLTYVTPGIFPDQFGFDSDARERLRRAWAVGREPVIVSAAMFRPGIKTQGLEWVIRACGRLLDEGLRLHLVIAGDGRQKNSLQALAETLAPGKVRFLGKIERNSLDQIYSAGDLFCFPGIRESLGMVYLEAQACGLPVVAFENGGIAEVVKNGQTGLLVPPFAFEAFVAAIKKLLLDPVLRRKMGSAARSYVRHVHDLGQNYRTLEMALAHIANETP